VGRRRHRHRSGDGYQGDGRWKKGSGRNARICDGEGLNINYVVAQETRPMTAGFFVYGKVISSRYIIPLPKTILVQQLHHLMPKTFTSQKLAVMASILLITVSIIGMVLWEAFADRLIETAFNGQSLPLVNKYVGIHRSIDPANRTLEYFLRNGRPVVPRLLGVVIAAQILLLLVLRYGKSTIKKFFSETTAPINLAVFRIVLFAALLGYLDVSQVVLFSRFPADLRVAPFGIGWLIDILPMSPAWAGAASYLFILVCVSGFLGFFSRTSAALALVLGFYVLGIPQFFGKIDHYHHLLWFAAILAASPCGDALSIDALIASRKKKNGEVTEPLIAYALPLRFVMLLMGSIYFFAGVWKFVIGGIGWATSDNMKYILYAQWFRLDWLPAFRIDQFPLLCKAAGIGVIVFELAFIFLLFFPRLRRFAALGGLLFHFSVYFFAHINFWTLALCYVVFIDFEPLYRRFVKVKPSVSGEIPATRILGIENPSQMPARPWQRKSNGIFVIGSLLFAINILFGITLIDSWPFAVYPTFASVEEKYLQSLTISLSNPDRTTTEIIPYKEQSLQSRIHPSRLIGLFTQVLWARDSTEVKRRGTALIQVLAEDDARIRHATSIRMYKDICSVIPEEQKKNPVRRDLLLSVQR
jgi:hypothetical protein